MFDIEKARAKGMNEKSIAIMEKINENNCLRESCTGHDFEKPETIKTKYRCLNCGCEEGIEYLKGYKDGIKHSKKPGDRAE
jgi:hypothetical protein